jgi:hypothetical protein
MFAWCEEPATIQLEDFEKTGAGGWQGDMFEEFERGADN